MSLDAGLHGALQASADALRAVLHAATVVPAAGHLSFLADPLLPHDCKGKPSFSLFSTQLSQDAPFDALYAPDMSVMSSSLLTSHLNLLSSVFFFGCIDLLNYIVSPSSCP